MNEQLRERSFEALQRRAQHEAGSIREEHAAETMRMRDEEIAVLKKQVCSSPWAVSSVEASRTAI